MGLSLESSSFSNGGGIINMNTSINCECGFNSIVSSKNDYFRVIEVLQKEVQQDTYLLMDNLYEKNASCIDTYTIFQFLKRSGYKAKYVLYKENPLFLSLSEKDELEDIIVVENSSLEGDELYDKLFWVLIRVKYIILSFPDSLYKDIRDFAYKNDKIQIVGVGHGPLYFKTSILNPALSNYIVQNDWNLYVVSSFREKRLLLEHNWPKEKIINIGLPRFDCCSRKKHKKRNILFMFTWRFEFREQKNIENFVYSKKLVSLLNSPDLIQLAQREDVNVIFSLHHSIKSLCDFDFKIPSCFKIADSNKLIDYINTCDLFVTDYSSIVHDFMFLHVPVIFYRLDYGDPLLGRLDTYDQEQCRKHDSELFNVFYTQKDTLDKVLYYVENDFVLEPEFVEVEDSFFTEKVDITKKLVAYLEDYSIEHISDGELCVLPIWSDNKVALCVSSSNEYAPYLCVYLKTVISHSEQKKDIVVFERDISDENKRKILECVSNSSTSIRFVNPSSYFKDTKLYISHDYFKEECYYRIVAPVVLSSYKKIIFTDLDLVLQDDIFKLAQIDLGDAPIAACIEPIWRELYMQNNRVYSYTIREYTNNILKLSNPFLYYNTGVVVIDVRKYNEFDSFKALLKIIGDNKLLYQEQCALNILFKDKFYTLPLEWNFELAPSLIQNKFDFDFYNEYKNSESDAKVLHYLGRYKPWKNAQEYKADIWWSIAKETPFYEEMLSTLLKHQIIGCNNVSQLRNELQNVHFPRINQHFATDEHRMFLLFVSEHLFFFSFKRLSYWIKMHVVRKDKREKYRNKFIRVSSSLTQAKSMKKAWKKS